MQQDYQPGACNIGEKELKVRQKFLLFFFSLTVALTIATHLTHSLLALLFLFLFTYSTIVLFVEVTTRFCVLFGFFGIYNFKALGNLDTIHDCRCKKRDRVKSFLILTGALILSVPYIWFVYKIACCPYLT